MLVAEGCLQCCPWQLLAVGDARLCPRCKGVGEDQVDVLVLYAFS